MTIAIVRDGGVSFVPVRKVSAARKQVKVVRK